MYSLSIQGTHAPKFQFKGNSGQEFRSFVESLVLNYVTLICSKYRSDLIYYSDKDRQDEILKAWFKVVGVDRSSEIKSNFKVAKGKNEVLESYFIDLAHLAKKRDHFYQYRKQLNLLINIEPNHPILQNIVGCAKHLSANMKSFNLPIIQADTHTIAYHLLKETKSFAEKAAKNYINN